MHVVLHFHELFAFAHETMMFQVFQLSVLVIRGPATCGEKFPFSFDLVAIKEEGVRGVLLHVHIFVWSPNFTQRSFLSDSSLAMLSESVAFADSITSSPAYAPWSIVETACAGPVVTDLRAGWDRVVLRRHTAKDTSERWYHGGTSRSETALRPGVRFSDVVQEGLFKHVPVASPALGPPGPHKNPSSPSKRKKKCLSAP